jgi:hypothetical protein
MINSFGVVEFPGNPGALVEQADPAVCGAWLHGSATAWPEVNA